MYFYCKSLDILIVVYVFLLFVHVFLTLYYVFLLLSMYSYCSSMYSYCCLRILKRGYLIEGFPCFFLGCKAHTRV
jgi:hypothetical protein